jgi:hypothetical protein
MTSLSRKNRLTADSSGVFLELPLDFAATRPEPARPPAQPVSPSTDLAGDLAAFCEFGEATRQLVTRAVNFAGCNHNW